MKTRSVPRRFLPWRLVGAVVLMMVALPAYALDYVFPGNLPIGCVDNSGGNYACGALALAADDTVTVAAPTPARIAFSGAFGGGAGVLLNAGSAASNLTLVLNGAFTLGAGSTMNATVQTLGAGAVSVGAGSTLSGNISTQTGYVTLGASTTMGGNINTQTGYVTLGVSAVVSGSVSTRDQGYVVLGASARVGGPITVFGGGYVTLGDSAAAGGSISTVSDAVTLGANSTVGGSVSVEETGGVTLGANSHVSGNVTTQVGATTVGAGGLVDGLIAMNGAGAITLGGGGRVYAICCNGKDASCLTDSSGVTPGPLICPAPTSTVANFDCLETGAIYNNIAANSGLRNPLYTKLAGTAFTFDVAAIKSDGTRATAYAAGPSKAVTLELVDGAGTTACSSRVALSPGVSQTLTFGATDSGRKTASVTLGRAYGNLRCRVTDASQSPSIVGCSGDNFAVRPAAITLLATPGANAPSATALPAVKAGTVFGLSASTQGANGYAGTLTLDTSKLTAQNPAQDATVQGGGVVGVLAPSTLVANAPTSNATYSEVGYFYLAAGAYRDDLFTLVDSANGDCIASTAGDQNLADTLVDGRYGCSVANQAVLSVGRFSADHFDVGLPALTAACSAGTAFSYFGQDGFATAFTLTAKNSAGSTTQNYSGAFARLDLSSYGNYGFSATPLPAGSTLTSGAAAPVGTWGQGVARVSARHQVSRPDAPAAETVVTVSAAPSDGEAGGNANAVVGNGARLRYGRLQMKNAYGSELLPLPVPLEAQYWAAGGYYVTNVDDSCTVIPVASLVMGNYVKQLSACATRLSPTGSVTLQSGAIPNGGLVLSRPGMGNAGSVDLQFNVTNVAHGNTCVSTATSLATAAHVPWFGNSPVARATFGIFKSPLVYRRENY